MINKENLNILIVEDDKVLSLLLSKMVERLSHSVVGTATKGQVAITSAKELNPDLILMDIMLEDNIDGIEAVLELQKLNYNIPVIFITGNSDNYNKTRAEATNYVDYLIKPINFEELKSSIDKVYT